MGPQLPSPPPVSMPPGSSVPPIARLTGYRILAVEDNELNRMVLQDLLSYEGSDLTSVENGREAMECLLYQGPDFFDVVLTDICMPEMNGLEMSRRIHAMDPELPVIGITANSLPEQRALCLEAGMADYISKPVDINRLVSLILNHATRRARGAERP